MGARTEEWVDRSRTTNANGSAPALPQRSFKTLILYPAVGAGSMTTQVVGAQPVAGPWPLILFSHGVTSAGSDYVQTLRVFASAGYVVVAPNYPLSNRYAPGGPTVVDVFNQIRGDVPFLITRALAESRAAGWFHGLIDPNRIGLDGHSLGAVTSIGAGFDPCCADPRVLSVAEWSGVFLPSKGPPRVSPLAKHRPLLIVHGMDDHTVPYGVAARLYAVAGTPKIEISLPGQGHIPAFVQGFGAPAARVAVESTLDFFDATLKGDPGGLTRIEAVVVRAGPKVAILREDLG